MTEINIGLLRASAPLMMVLDPEGRVILWNQACSDLTGYSFEEARGRYTWDFLTAPEDRPHAKEAYRQLLAGQRPTRLEAYLVTKSGERRWIGWSHDLTRGPDGRVEFVTAIGIDRTDAKTAEDALRVSEARFAGIISIAADAIISIDEDQRIVVFNEGAERIFGWTRDEVIGKPLDLLLPPRFRAAHRAHIQSFEHEPTKARRMGVGRTEILGLRKNGVEFHACVAISKLHVDGVHLYTAVLRDITEQKLTERNERFLAEVGTILATTLAYEDTLTRIAELAVRFLCDCCIIDLVEEEGAVRRWRVVHRDPSKADLARRLELVEFDPRKPHPVWGILETKAYKLIPEITPGFLEGMAQSDDHLRALFELRPTSAVALPLIAHGRVLGTMALIRSEGSRAFGRDEIRVCEALAYRAALALESARLYRSAQEAIRDRDQVLSVVAHDLRNPLNAALLAAETLQLRQPAHDREPEARKATQIIERSLRRANRLIQDLLDVTRIDTGKLVLEKRRVAIAELLTETAEAFGALADQASIRLDVAVLESPLDVLADKERALQVLWNLVSNALKFTPPGGVVGIAAIEYDGEVRISVADNGPGISSEDLPHIFERYWQASRADKRGTGLGLPIAKGIVEAHGGRIWVDSTPGAGSTFFFTLPVLGRAEQRRDGEARPW